MGVPSGAKAPAERGDLIAVLEALRHPKPFFETFRAPSVRVRWNQDLNVSGAKAGMARRFGIPATSFERSRRNGSCVVRLTRPGACDATRAHRSMLPKA